MTHVIDLYFLLVNLKGSNNDQSPMARCLVLSINFLTGVYFSLFSSKNFSMFSNFFASLLKRNLKRYGCNIKNTICVMMNVTCALIDEIM